MRALFASDLHGRRAHYRALWAAVRASSPDAVFLGGDLLPAGLGLVEDAGDFLEEFLFPGLRRLRADMRGGPRVFAIFGNDDPRCEEAAFAAAEREGLLEYVHGRVVECEGFLVCGYACVPPTPFLLKDWERYDVSRFVDPGCISPEEGCRTVPVPETVVRYGTIAQDLAAQAAALDPSRTIWLLHTPPYRTALDRAALDGRVVDHVPVDVHVGSIAVRRFIEGRQPLLTLHGHIHESARLTGAWRERIGRTWCLSAAHDGPELALVEFDTDALESADRHLHDTASPEDSR